MPNDDTTIELVDIRSVSVDKNLPQAARIAEFVRQIRNPFNYKCGNYIITAEFAENGPSIEQCLQGLSA